jgi:hypothetical protein
MFCFSHDWKYHGPGGGHFSVFRCTKCGKFDTKPDTDH